MHLAKPNWTLDNFILLGWLVESSSYICTRIFSWIGDRVTKTPDPQLIFDSWIYFMRRNWKLFYWKIIKLFSNMLSAFILTSCHRSILASFFTPTAIIVLMDNVMKFKFFSSIILTNCHKNNIKPLHLVDNVNYYFQFISSLFFLTFPACS